MSSEATEGAKVGDVVGALPLLVLLVGLLVSVAWWIEPVRYAGMRVVVPVHETFAKRAVLDDSERIMMLGCKQFDRADRAELAETLLEERPRLQQRCVSDVYRVEGE
ncbi:MAG: hypothetical protein ACQEVA_22930 [Myxococcota bacterium]